MAVVDPRGRACCARPAVRRVTEAITGFVLVALGLRLATDEAGVARYGCSGEALPPDHLRVPDERARLRADEGHARVARLRTRPASAARRRPDPLQHLLDPREGGHAARRPPGRGQRLKREDPSRVVGVGRLLVAVDEGEGVRAVPVRGRGVRARARCTGWPSSSTATASARRATSSSRASPATCRCSASATSRAGCRSRWAATACAPTASCRPPAGARCRGPPRSWSRRSSGWPPTACAR